VDCQYCIASVVRPCQHQLEFEAAQLAVYVPSILLNFCDQIAIWLTLGQCQELEGIASSTFDLTPAFSLLLQGRQFLHRLLRSSWVVPERGGSSVLFELRDAELLVRQSKLVLNAQNTGQQCLQSPFERYNVASFFHGHTLLDAPRQEQPD
jgi:hypothetical protein